MIKKTIASFLFFVITLIYVSAEQSNWSFIFQTSPEMTGKKDFRYSTKSQFGFAGNVYLSYDFADSYFLQAGLGYSRFRPSGAGSDWVIYRGYSVFYFGAGLGMYFPSRSFFGLSAAFEPGIALVGLASLARYTYTDIYFFYPRIKIEPFALLSRHFDNYIELRMGAPFSWNFQRDLSVSLTLGLSVSAVLYLPKISSTL